MSIQSSFYHKETQIKPNEVHNLAPNGTAENKMDDGTKVYTPGSILSAEAHRRLDAMQAGGVKPDLYYGEEEQIPVHGRNQEPPHAVESKLEMREEYPYG